ncbi:hypothetical protein LV79_004375 [Actinokineospora globicatena]|nr:hypothetical protein [Actinokineospora globicatena]
MFGVVGALCALVTALRALDRYGPEFGRALRGETDVVRDWAAHRLAGSWEALVATSIGPAIHRYARGQRIPVRGRPLDVHPTHALYQEDEDEPDLVETESVRRLTRVLERSDSGAVALAGRRGVGKSTLIRALASGAVSASGTPPLTVIASAPAAYDARDFVLHLYALLCRQVIAAVDERGHGTGVDPLTLAGARLRRRASFIRRLLWMIALVLGAAGSVVVPAVATGTSVLTTAKDLASQVYAPDREATIGAAVAAVLVGLLVIEVARLALAGARSAFERLLAAVRSDDDLAVLGAVAREHLDRVRFLQTFTTGWSGKVSLPLQGEVSRTRQAQRAEQPLTHPEVVADFRLFAGQAARVLRTWGRGARVVIAVDEVDKIGQPEKAHEFVNDIKGVFGIPGCLFLVSVSDDAVAAFERRGIAVRDAFDSAFSEMLVLRPFSLDESAQWLGDRVPGLSREFVMLCHCLSAGVPRELRRHAIEMVDLTADSYRPDVASVADLLVRADVTRKAAAFADVAAGIEDDRTPEFLSWVEALPAFHGPVDLAVLADPNRYRDSGLWRVNGQAAALALLSATVLAVFTDEFDVLRSKGLVDDLVLARRQVGADWRVGLETVRRVRAALDLQSS